MSEPQVIIVGAGPAGSACAKALKEEEIDVRQSQVFKIFEDGWMQDHCGSETEYQGTQCRMGECEDQRKESEGEESG